MDAFEQAQAELSNWNRPRPQAPKKKRGGIGGFLEGAVRGITSPFEYLINTAIVNPTKELAAEFTGNKVAKRNATRESNRELGLGESGTNLGGGLKKFLGNTAQVGLDFVAPGATSIGKQAALGSAFGASSALADEGSSLDDILHGGVSGGIFGGAVGAGGNLLSRLLGKTANRGAASAVNDVGRRLESRSAGVGVGEKIGGKELSVVDSRRMLKLLKDEKIPTGHPETRLEAIATRLDDYGKQIDKAAKGANRTLAPLERKGLGANYLKRLQDDISNDANVLTHGQGFAERFKKIKSVEDAIKQKRNIQNDAINYGRAEAAAVPGKEKAAREAVKVLDEFISGVSPELKTLNGKWSSLKEASDFMTKGAGRLTRSSESGGSGGNPIKALLTGDVAQTVKSKSGGIINKVLGGRGEAGASTPNMFAKLLGGGDRLASTATQVGARDAAQIPEEEDIASAFDVQSGLDAQAGEQEAAQAQAQSQAAAEQEANNPFSRTNIQKLIMADIAQNDGKNLSSLMSLYEMFGQPAEAEGLNSTSAGIVTDLQGGLSALDELGQHVEESGANKPIIGGLLAGIPFNTGAKNLQADIATVKQLIGKALEGGVLRKEDEAKYAKILPTINDTDEVARYKIAKVRSLLENKLALYQHNLGGGGGGNDLSSLMQPQLTQ